MKIVLFWPDNVPESEFSAEFLQAMLSRMATSYSHYGAVKEGFPNRVDALKSMQLRLDKYKETGNLEYVIDAANFLMIEFMHPKRVDTFWDAAGRSPGRVWHGEIDPLRDRNDLK